MTIPAALARLYRSADAAKERLLAAAVSVVLRQKRDVFHVLQELQTLVLKLGDLDQMTNAARTDRLYRTADGTFLMTAEWSMLRKHTSWT
jgi:hypothetical protein